MNEVRAYQTFVWQKDPKIRLYQFNLRSLTFDSSVEDVNVELEGLTSGQYTFQNPILKGKDFSKFNT